MTSANLLSHWRLADELTVTQAALAIIGNSPGDDAVKGTPEFKAVLAALTHAIEGGRLPARQVYKGHWEVDWEPDLIVNTGGTWHPVGSLDVDQSRVMIADLHAWLSARGMVPAFFAEKHAPPSSTPDLDSTYPPKLRAAFLAFRACRAAEASGVGLQGFTPKQWMTRYILDRPELGISQTGADEASTVANWQEKGGAPRTPGG